LSSPSPGPSQAQRPEYLQNSLFGSSPFYDAYTNKLEEKPRTRNIYKRFSNITGEVQPVVTEICLRLNPLGPRTFQFYHFTAMIKTNPDMPPLSKLDMLALIGKTDFSGDVEDIKTAKTSPGFTTASGRITAKQSSVQVMPTLVNSEIREPRQE
jgi:hypothetical protein